MQDQPSTSLPRIIGTETEFGIAPKEAAVADPVAGSIAVIGHYTGLPAPDAIWDYENENPLVDASGVEVEGERERPNPDYKSIFKRLTRIWDTGEETSPSRRRLPVKLYHSRFSPRSQNLK